MSTAAVRARASLLFEWLCGLSFALAVLLVSTTATAQSPSRPPAELKLPGRLIDVKAGEFFFQAPDTIPSGLVTLRLTQIGMLAERHAAGMTGRALVADKGDDTRGFHMLWLVRLNEGKTAADLLHAAESGERLPSWATHLGGPGSALPPRSTNATLVLEPGNYVMVCFVGSAREDRKRYHFLNGMFRTLTVVRSSAPVAALPRTDVVARIVDEGVVEFSTPLRVGRQILRVENTTDKGKEFKFQRPPAGATASEFLAKPNGGPGLVWGGLSNVPPGGSVTTTMEFEAGEYIVGTWPALRHPTSRVISVTPNR